MACGAGLLKDRRPVSDAGTNAKFLDGEADHVFEGERSCWHMGANEVAPEFQAGLKMYMGEYLLCDVWVPVEGEQFSTDVAQNECVEVAGFQDRPSASRWNIRLLNDAIELTHAESEMRQLSRQRDDLATSKDQRERRLSRWVRAGAEYVPGNTLHRPLMDGDVRRDSLVRSSTEQEATAPPHP